MAEGAVPEAEESTGPTQRWECSLLYRWLWEMEGAGGSAHMQKAKRHLKLSGSRKASLVRGREKSGLCMQIDEIQWRSQKKRIKEVI